MAYMITTPALQSITWEFAEIVVPTIFIPQDTIMPFWGTSLGLPIFANPHPIRDQRPFQHYALSANEILGCCSGTLSYYNKETP